MNNLPSDPHILASYVNTKLRDDYTDLDDLCESLGVDKEGLLATLKSAGYDYSLENKRFY